jgi:hypothetical protein
MTRTLTIKIVALIASAWLGVMVAGFIASVVAVLMTSGRIGGDFFRVFFLGSAMGLPTMFLLFFVQLAKIIDRWYREKNSRIYLSSWAITIDALLIILVLWIFASVSYHLMSLWLFISLIQVPTVFKCQAIFERLITTYLPE